MSKLHTVFPTSKQPEYKPSDTVNVKLSYDNRKFKANSVRISGSLTVEEAAGTIIADATNIFYDSSVGVHGFFSSFSTSMEKLGIVENVNDYPRLYKMKEVCLQSKDTQIATSSNLCELKGPADVLTNKMLAGKSDTDYSLAFSFKPDIGVNNMTGNMSFRKYGAVELQFRLENLERVLFGSGAASTNVIKIEDLQIQYETVPDNGVDDEVIMYTKHSLKQVISSANAHVSTTVPGVCLSVSCSFLPTANDSKFEYNQTELVKPPNVSKIQFSWNDMSTGYISYPLEYEEEILFNYLESMGSKGHNQMSLKKLAVGKMYGAGLKFPSPTDLSNQSVGIEVNSDIDNTTKHYIYMIFRAKMNL